MVKPGAHPWPKKLDSLGLIALDEGWRRRGFSKISEDASPAFTVRPAVSFPLLDATQTRQRRSNLTFTCLKVSWYRVVESGSGKSRVMTCRPTAAVKKRQRVREGR